MKLIALTAAALVTAAVATPVPATAQHAPQRHGGWHYRTKTVCKVRWQGHRKVRTCRKVRVRYHR